MSDGFDKATVKLILYNIFSEILIEFNLICWKSPETL